MANSSTRVFDSGGINQSDQRTEGRRRTVFPPPKMQAFRHRHFSARKVPSSRSLDRYVIGHHTITTKPAGLKLSCQGL
jgi:hypothetical protein